MKWTRQGSAIAVRCAEAQVNCQFQSGLISAQSPRSTPFSSAWSRPSPARCVRAKAAQRAAMSCSAQASVSTITTPALK